MITKTPCFEWDKRPLGEFHAHFYLKLKKRSREWPIFKDFRYTGYTWVLIYFCFAHEQKHKFIPKALIKLEKFLNITIYLPCFV